MVTKVLAGDEIIWQRGKAQNLSTALSFIEETDHTLKFSAQPGRYRLVVHYDAQ